MKKQRAGNKKKLIIGITGSFGTGKSTVAKIFKSYGAQVIDADRIARSVINRGSKVYKEIIGVFGRGILKKDGSVDRRKLAQTIFTDGRLRVRLNKIIHPKIISVIKEKIKLSDSRLIVLDAPLLIEAGLRNFVDKLIVIKVGEKLQIARVLKRANFKESEVLEIIGSQIPLEDKVRIADFVIDNSKTVENTKRQVRQIMLRLRSVFLL